MRKVRDRLLVAELGTNSIDLDAPVGVEVSKVHISDGRKQERRKYRVLGVERVLEPSVVPS